MLTPAWPAIPRFRRTVYILLGFVNVERGQKTVFKLDRMRALCESLATLNPPAEASMSPGQRQGLGIAISPARSKLRAEGRPVREPAPPALEGGISLAGDEMPEEILLAAAAEVLPSWTAKGLRFPGRRAAHLLRAHDAHRLLRLQASRLRSRCHRDGPRRTP